MGLRAAYRSAVLADGPVGYWPLDDPTGPAASNLVGGGAAGSYGGSFFLGQPGVFDDATAMYTPPSGGYMLVPVGVWANPAAFSFEYLCRPDAGQSNAYQLTVANGANGNFAQFDTGLSGGNFTEDVWTAPNVASTHVGGVSVNDGLWHHICATFDSSRLELFTDGQIDIIAPVVPSPQTLANSTIGIGGWSQRAASAITRVSGLYTDFAFYGYALNAAQAAAHYQAAAANSSMQIGGGGVGQVNTKLLNEILAAVRKTF